MGPGGVVVGVDGSAPSRSALKWAAAEATRCEVPLRIVHAYRPTWPDSTVSPAQSERVAADQARETVAAAAKEAAEHAGTVPVTADLVRGGAAAVLLETAGPDDLVVVGSRGHSTLAATFAGSTCQQVALHAAGSVAVVRGRADTAAGPVVVGVDGSPDSVPAIRVALREAHARGCALVAVRAFRPGAPAWPGDASPPDVFNAASTRKRLVVELDRLVQPIVHEYPTVPVEHHAVGGDAAHVLVTFSQQAQLVVVGSRGHGGFAGLLLGSVGLHLLHHADCPVFIVRA